MPSNPTSLIAKRPAAKVAMPAAPVEPLRWYRVKEDRMVPRKGSAAFLLKKGKEINSVFIGPTTMKDLSAAGVELDEIETPSWYYEAQAQARDTHQGMLDRGHDVGEVPPPYEAPKVARAAKAAETTS